MERLPHWLRGVLSLEAAYRWRALAAEGAGVVVSGATAFAVHLRHRICAEVHCVDPGALLREPVVMAGLPVASPDDALVALLGGELTGEHLADLRQLELRTPLQLEEGLILLAHVRPEIRTEQVITRLSAAVAAANEPVAAYWELRLPEVQASLSVRGFVPRVTVPRQRNGHRPALTLGSSGLVWVEPHERDGQQVAGYWRRR
ncbi:MAG: hypothetical protein HOV79_28270 [Hamadaea sp.]|nr:hypothetical protein [Hamadaea sp.]